jgi:hypothetical protein
MKRTTLVLHEKTFADVKRVAAEERRTISEVVDEFLREGLERRRGRSNGKKIRLPTYDLGTAHVDVADRDALYDLMEGR